MEAKQRKEKAHEKGNHGLEWRPLVGKYTQHVPFPNLPWAWTLLAFPCLLGLGYKPVLHGVESIRLWGPPRGGSKGYKKGNLKWGGTPPTGCWSTLMSWECTVCCLLNKSSQLELSWAVISILCYKKTRIKGEKPTQQSHTGTKLKK